MAVAPVASRPRLGVSSCLLGHEVRYNGGHKRDAFLLDVLGPYVEWIAVCPEVEIGLGTPRPAMRLVRLGGEASQDIRLITPETGADHTAAMRSWAERRVAELAAADLDGYVLKKSSPSCGMERVELYRLEGGAPDTTGRGLFAAALLKRLPHLPVEEEGRLNDPLVRESFIRRVFIHLHQRQWCR